MQKIKNLLNWFPNCDIVVEYTQNSCNMSFVSAWHENHSFLKTVIWKENSSRLKLRGMDCLSLELKNARLWWVESSVLDGVAKARSALGNFSRHYGGYVKRWTGVPSMQELKEQLLFFLTEFLALRCLLLQRLLQLILLLGQLAERIKIQESLKSLGLAISLKKVF